MAQGAPQMVPARSAAPEATQDQLFGIQLQRELLGTISVQMPARTAEEMLER
jgi:hypothetical protein